jgi:cytochrome P450 family 6
LEKGLQVLIPVTLFHYDPKYYPEPDRFDPESFSEEEKQKRHHYVYLPFGEGPRIRIGKLHTRQYIKKKYYIEITRIITFHTWSILGKTIACYF